MSISDVDRDFLAISCGFCMCERIKPERIVILSEKSNHCIDSGCFCVVKANAEFYPGL